MLSSSLFWIIPGSIAGNMKLRWNKGRGLQTKGLKGWAAKGNLWKISQIFIKIGDFTSALSISIRAGNLLIPSSLISSFCSNQMSNCEQFAQITQDKWATLSEALRSPRGNERLRAIRSNCSEEMSDVSESLISLTKNKRMSDSLKKFWLTKSKILFYYVLLKVFF